MWRINQPNSQVFFFYLTPPGPLRLNGRPVEAEADYERRLSEETAKLQRLYGGGDLSSFPQFTFTGEKDTEAGGAQSEMP